MTEITKVNRDVEAPEIDLDELMKSSNVIKDDDIVSKIVVINGKFVRDNPNIVFLDFVIDGTMIDIPPMVKLAMGEDKKKELYRQWLDKNTDKAYGILAYAINQMLTSNTLHIKFSSKGILAKVKIEVVRDFFKDNLSTIVSVAKVTAGMYKDEKENKMGIMHPGFDEESFKKIFARDVLKERLGEGNFNEEDINKLANSIKFNENGAPGVIDKPVETTNITTENKNNGCIIEGVATVIDDIETN